MHACVHGRRYLRTHQRRKPDDTKADVSSLQEDRHFFSKATQKECHPFKRFSVISTTVSGFGFKSWFLINSSSRSIM